MDRTTGEEIREAYQSENGYTMYMSPEMLQLQNDLRELRAKEQKEPGESGSECE